MSKLKLVDICKSYGNNLILNKFNLNIDKNEFLVVIGPSGCGKSTLLKCIGGIIDINSGSITLDGQPINDIDTAMVFQEYALFPSMKVQDNIMFGLNKKKVLKDLYEITENLKIDKLKNRYPSELSGGEKQRVAIARALIRRPKVYLFDEPLSNVDAVIKKELIEEIKELYSKNDAMFIYVTHDQNEAFNLATKILIMNNGEILQYGTREEIINNPTSMKVVNFLTSLTYNILEGTIKYRNKKYYINCYEKELLLDNRDYNYKILKNYINKNIFFCFQSNQIDFSENGIFEFKVKKTYDLGINKKINLDVVGNNIVAFYNKEIIKSFNIVGKVLIFDKENQKNIFV